MTTTRKTGVLFICLGNSCRSIMAEALARRFFGHLVEPASAGLVALGRVAPETLEVLEEVGAPTAGLFSKDLTLPLLETCPLVVNLTSHPLTRLLPADYQGKVVGHAIHDPYGQSLETYRRTRDDIINLLQQELLSWLKL
jgi:protein-tyrosine-phosphatase